jgi:uncharacterized protein with HEPN domain
MSEKDRGNMLAIIDSGEKILRFIQEHESVDGFYADEKSFDAVLLNFVVIGESVARLSKRIKESNPNVPWNQIKGFRNFVVHDYFGVDAEEVWQIIQNHLPKLLQDISTILDSSNP